MDLTLSLEGVRFGAILISCGQISLFLTTKSIKLGNSLPDKVVELSLLETCESRWNNAEGNVLQGTSQKEQGVSSTGRMTE